MVVMSNRLTPRWVPTAEGAYGKTGKKGKIAEDIHDDWWRSQGANVYSCENDKLLQVQGIDSIVEMDGWSFTVDVKGNWNQDRSFYVEASPNGWLFNTNKISTLITHINIHNKKMFCYHRNHMIKYLKSNEIPIVYMYGHHLHVFDKEQLSECKFITFLN